MSPIARRELGWQPGVLMALLLVLLLALGGRPCPMLAQTDPAPPSNHDCCFDPFATSDRPDSPSPSPCDDGPCLQAVSPHDWVNFHGSTASDSNQPSQPLVAAWQSPSDRSSGGRLFQILAAKTTGPPPAQRSRVLRL